MISRYLLSIMFNIVSSSKCKIEFIFSKKKLPLSTLRLINPFSTHNLIMFSHLTSNIERIHKEAKETNSSKQSTMLQALCLKTILPFT